MQASPTVTSIIDNAPAGTRAGQTEDGGKKKKGEVTNEKMSRANMVDSWREKQSARQTNGRACWRDDADVETSGSSRMITEIISTIDTNRVKASESVECWDVNEDWRRMDGGCAGAVRGFYSHVSDLDAQGGS